MILNDMSNCDIALVLILVLCVVLIITWMIIEKLRKNIKWLNARINTMQEVAEDRYTRILHGWSDTIKTAQELVDASRELIDIVKGEKNHDSE